MPISNLSEILNEKKFISLLNSDEIIRCYYGIEPVARPTLNHYIPLIAIKELTSTGKYFVTILIADLHAYLHSGVDNNDVDDFINDLKAMIKILGINDKCYEIIKGMSFQTDRKYFVDVCKLMVNVNITEAKKATSDVIKVKNNNCKISTVVYPLMQIADECALSADIQIGGKEQKKLFLLSMDNIEKINKSKCSYLLLENLPLVNVQNGQSENKMIHGKYGFNIGEGVNSIMNKIMNAFNDDIYINYYSSDGTHTKGLNCLVSIVKRIIFPIKCSFMDYKDYNDFEKAYIDKKINKDHMYKCLCDEIKFLL